MNDLKRIIIVASAFGLLVLGALGIKDFIESSGYKKQVNYTTSIKVTEKDNFNYSVDSKQGRVLATGRFSSNPEQLVKLDEMTKGFSYVKRVKEHYTAHTRCGGKPVTCSTYHSWDYSGKDEVGVEKISIFDRQYNLSIFNIDSMLESIDACDVTQVTEKAGWLDKKRGCSNNWGKKHYYIDRNDRYYYEVVPAYFTATFITSTYDGDLKPVGQSKILLEDKSIDQVLDGVGSYKVWASVVFIILLVLFTISSVYLAYIWVMEDGEWSMRD